MKFVRHGNKNKRCENEWNYLETIRENKHNFSFESFAPEAPSRRNSLQLELERSGAHYVEEEGAPVLKYQFSRGW